jgi:hypothetical protein
MAESLCQSLLPGIKQACAELGPVNRSKSHLGRWHGENKSSHLSFTLDCPTPIPTNYTGSFSFGKRLVEDAEEIEKEQWKEAVTRLGRSVTSDRPEAVQTSVLKEDLGDMSLSPRSMLAVKVPGAGTGPATTSELVVNGPAELVLEEVEIDERM